MRPSVRRLGQRLRPEGAPPPAGVPRLRKGVVVSEASGVVTLTLAGDTLTLPKLAHVGPLAAGEGVGVAVGSTDQAINVTWNDDSTTPARLWVAYLW